jgi:UDP-N-acetylmuramoylalanine--D-glutamate ligase
VTQTAEGAPGPVPGPVPGRASQPGRVLVVGLGQVTGSAVVEALTGLGTQVRVVESDSSPAHLATAAEFARHGVEVLFGTEDPALVEWADVVIPSPGVPPHNPLLTYAAARGRKVWSEIELGFRLARGPLAAITGTNGKTTTTTLLTRILQDAGLPAVAAGNIGVPLVSAARSAPEGTWLICEVSSFQLRFIERFRPEVAIVLNVADDHYDWHPGPADYLSSKARITENQRAEDLLIVAGDDEGCRAIAAGSAAELAVFGHAGLTGIRAGVQDRIGRGVVQAAGIEDGGIVIDRGPEQVRLMNLGDIRMQGLHNLENIQAASLAALRIGVPAESIARTVAGFENLEHRTTEVAELEGVRYVNDSKATNPHATLKALNGLDRVVLIAGGRAKGLDLSVLTQCRPRLVGLVVMGEAAGELKALFSDMASVEAADVEEAVRLAAAMASPGDTVLLSPGCASLDQYSSYAERGRRFAAAVKAL